MADYLISIMRPEGYLHSSCFFEIAETLQYGLRSLGHDAVVAENTAGPHATTIILGAHLISPQNLGALPDGTIIYNLEQLGDKNVPSYYYPLVSRYQIWDASPQNIERWKQWNCVHAPLLVEIGYVPNCAGSSLLPYRT